MPNKIILTQHTEQLLDGDQIASNPLNNSPSKQQYSFSKAERFQRNKSELSNSKFYNLPSTRSKKVTTIGNAQRLMFASNKNNIQPSPNNYVYAIDGEFGDYNSTKKKDKGVKFRLGRSDIKVDNFMEIAFDNPGPGRYDPNPEISMKRISEEMSFQKEVKFKSQKMLTSDIGNYNLKSLVNFENRILSNQSKRLCPKIMEIKIQRRVLKTQASPPLCNMQFIQDVPKTTFKGNLVDLYNSKKAITIGHEKRKSPELNQISPRPKYQIFSQFISKRK